MPHRLLYSNLDWITKIGIAIAAWLLPAGPALLGLFGLMLIDTILGIKASMTEGVKISSRRLSNLLSKVIVYSLGVLATHILQQVFIQDLFNVFKLVVFVFASIEILSIYENISRIFGIDIVKIIKGIFKRKGLDEMNDVINAVENANKKRRKKN